jgi:hypothetical protein
MDVEASFLTGSILTLILPLALLLGILVWWIAVLRRRSSDDA